ncbi:hypothetical protein M9458_017823, partial [Cirrhinus mrigala]
YVEEFFELSSRVEEVKEHSSSRHSAPVEMHCTSPAHPTPGTSQHDPEPSQLQTQLTKPEPEPKATEPSHMGATAQWIATEPEPSLSDQVREPAMWPTTVDVTVGREGAEDSTAHGTATEGEQCLDLELLDIELDLTNFSEDIYVELPACHELSACLGFPPTHPPSVISSYRPCCFSPTTA